MKSIMLPITRDSTLGEEGIPNNTHQSTQEKVGRRTSLYNTVTIPTSLFYLEQIFVLSLVPSCISNEAVKKQSGYGYHSTSGGATSLLDHICAMGTTKTSLAAITPKP